MEARRVLIGDDTAEDTAPIAEAKPARRALLDDETPQARRLSSVTRWGLAALSTVGLLVGSVLLVPGEVDGAAHTDPNTLALPSERSESLSRTNQRTPLPLAASPSVTPEASGTPEPTPEATETAVEATPEPAEEATPEASPEPTPEPTSAQPAPSPAVPAFGEIVGEKWATKSVHVRKGPGTDFGILATIGAGKKVSVTSVVEGRWQQVKAGKHEGFIVSEFLTDEEPAAAPEAQGVSGGKSSCPQAARIESGLTDRTVGVLRAVCNKFPNVRGYHGRRAGGGSYHSSGRAIDVMISGKAGWEIANWARANASELGVIEVIYEQKIWTTQRSGDGWRHMSDRGSVSANHYDHVHISVR